MGKQFRHCLVVRTLENQGRDFKLRQHLWNCRQHFFGSDFLGSDQLGQTEPVVPLEEGLKKTIEYFRQHPDLI